MLNVLFSKKMFVTTQVAPNKPLFEPNIKRKKQQQKTTHLPAPSRGLGVVSNNPKGVVWGLHPPWHPPGTVQLHTFTTTKNGAASSGEKNTQRKCVGFVFFQQKTGW